MFAKPHVRGMASGLMENERRPHDRIIRSELVALLPTLTRFALALTGSRPDADDLVQETCERAIRHIDRWQIGTRLDSWLFRIAQNLHRNQRRKNANAQRIQAMMNVTQSDFHDGAKSAEHRSMIMTVGQHLLTLPKEQREVVMLVCVEGYSYDETATILNLPIGTVTSRLGRARLNLREIMKDSNRHQSRSARRWQA